MARNIEIKARVDDIRALERRVVAIGGAGPQPIAQDDTFFRCENGRLKLRAFDDGTGQLIFYRRADEQGPKESFYVMSETAGPDGLRQALTLAYGMRGRVRKQRLLYMMGRTRIHLDRVEGLGDFMELEVVLADGEAAGDGMREAQQLMARLGVDAAQLVEGAYLDLLEGKTNAAAVSE
ncbi:class IV adenylate cyclase [Noviherbaspirillum aridicola]|uniref:Adenylate cyclase n=1 Tax=Noviherbaspirillum aridicola TaxID=2849687 RepID=A0ABQ4Q675_9BURK|nr:class IV adenylate cyclase [Noviherbaspirillum aridicola]GIZ52726.1 adenylate cyclase [Noviherbaspirillum aridicola]